MDIPVEYLEDIKILLKQCYFFEAVEKLMKIEKELQFFSKSFIFIVMEQLNVEIQASC